MSNQIWARQHLTLAPLPPPRIRQWAECSDVSIQLPCSWIDTSGETTLGENHSDQRPNHRPGTGQGRSLRLNVLECVGGSRGRLRSSSFRLVKIDTFRYPRRISRFLIFIDLKRDVFSESCGTFRDPITPQIQNCIRLCSHTTKTILVIGMCFIYLAANFDFFNRKTDEGRYVNFSIYAHEQGCGVDQISATPTPTPTPAWKNRLRLQLWLQLRLRPTSVSFFTCRWAKFLKQWYLLCNAFDEKYCWQTRQQSSVKVCQDLALYIGGTTTPQWTKMASVTEICPK